MELCGFVLWGPLALLANAHIIRFVGTLPLTSSLALAVCMAGQTIVLYIGALSARKIDFAFYEQLGLFC
jgi:hypothetical protein